MLEASLRNERQKKMHARNVLKEAEKKLFGIAAQQEQDNQCCLDATQKVENFKKKVNDALSKISTIEAKLTMAKKYLKKRRVWKTN